MEFSFPIEFISEGAVRIAVPRLRDFISTPSDYAPSKAPVFFNPVMELISVYIPNDLHPIGLSEYDFFSPDGMSGGRRQEKK